MREIARYFKSHDFKKALLGTGLMVVLGTTLFMLGWTQPIVGVCVGILLTSFVDIQGDNRLRILSMLILAVMITVNFFMINVLYDSVGLLLLYIALAALVISYLAVYGSRAARVSFSGLMSIVLSLIRSYEGDALLLQWLYLMAGCVAYLLASTLYHWITRKTQIIEQLGRLAELTSDFIQLRLKSYEAEDSNTYEQPLASLQIEIIEKQEGLRTLLLSRRKESGYSRSRADLFMILVSLIDIMELAVANPSLIKRFKTDVNNSPYYLKPFIENLQYLAKAIRAISHTLLDDRFLFDQKRQSHFLDEQDKYIKHYVDEVGLPEARPGALAMHQLKKYVNHQGKKIDNIFKILLDDRPQVSMDVERSKRFLSEEQYRLGLFKDNIDLKSPIFRHSIRLTLAMVAGYGLGLLMGVVNAYWILLTIVVIMRPNYGLTKARSINRVLGTLVGVIIAIGIVLVVHNPYVFIMLAAVANIFAFSMLNRNYFLSSVAVTLSVIFIFSVLQSDKWEVIEFRLIDTVIGGVISLLASYLIFPHWENDFIDKAISDLSASLAAYQEAIYQLFNDPDHETEYRLMRKAAFIESSAMQASLQRLLQDPKSKRSSQDDYIAMVTWYQEILSSQAKIGTYISDNKVIESQRPELKEAMLTLRDKMKNLSQGKREMAPEDGDGEQAYESLSRYWEQIQRQRNKEIDAGQRRISTEDINRLQEVNLIKGEVEWIEELLAKIKKVRYKIAG